MAILELQNLTKNFGGLSAIHDLSFAVDQGELRCIIGPNGAGKSTLFDLISGKLKPDAGQIIFNGQSLSGLSVYQISRRGIGRKFQSPTIFGDLSILVNLQVAARGYWAFKELIFPRSDEYTTLVKDILSIIHLEGKQNFPAQSLSHGEKQWLEIGMVLASRAELLLLDEPTAGMTPAETHQTAQLIQQISREITTIVIEHDLKFIREIASIVTVLYRGSLLAQGSIDDIAQDQSVRQAYLGTKVL